MRALLLLLAVSHLDGVAHIKGLHTTAFNQLRNSFRRGGKSWELRLIRRLSRLPDQRERETSRLRDSLLAHTFVIRNMGEASFSAETEAVKLLSLL